jgi:hypothetical protein
MYSHLIKEAAMIGQFTTFKQAKAAFRAASSQGFAHARSRKWCGHWVTHLYVVDATSPSGLIAAASGDDSVMTEILRRCGRTSPLSPTEGL